MRNCITSLVLMLIFAPMALAAEHVAKPALAVPGEQEFVGCKKYPPSKRFKWNVRGEVGLGELVASLGELSCQPIVVGSGISQRGGKVALEVPDLVTAGEVYRLFYAALEVMGLTVERAGSTLKIVDAGRSREVATPELDGVQSGGDRFVIRLVRPRHAAAADLAEVLGKMKSKEGDISVFGGSALVVMDRAGNVQRMEEVVQALDVADAGARVYALGTHGQTATELAGAIDKIIGATRRGQPAADGKQPTPRAGSDDVRALIPVDSARLVVIVGNDAGWARVQQLAARLDPVAEEGSLSQAHVIYLANTNAEDIAATLQTVGLTGRAGATPRPGGSGAPAPSPSGMGGLPLSGDVRIGADKVANALVVFANGLDFQMVSDLVTKLDVPRRQVYVEAVILDLSVDKTRNLGLSFHQAGGVGSAAGFAASGTNSIEFNSQTAASMLVGGLTAGMFGPSFSVAGQSIPSFGVMLQALEHNKDVNVISRPHLLTMDNMKASISVGQQIVFQTSAVGAVTGTSLISNYQRQPVALTMELTPHLNESDTIRLEIDGTIEDVAEGQSSTAPGGPSTNQRKLKTAVVVHDGETVVLGGLQKESDSESIDKIPLLGDIPLLGRLFQTRSKSRVKQDLLIVLTPYIIRGPEDLRRIECKRQQEREEFLERSSAFQDRAGEARIDYRRRRGLLEEVNVVAIKAEREAEALRVAERALKPHKPDGPIDISAPAEVTPRAP